MASLLGASFRKFLRRFFSWNCAFAMVVYCGTLLDRPEMATFGSDRSMWIRHLFSEYEPPRWMHMDLYRSYQESPAVASISKVPPDLWDPPNSNGWNRCAIASPTQISAHVDGGRYLQVLCGGGLFQLHICVCNAVAVAKLLRLTLVIPYFKLHPFWNDPSQFEDIYDINHFTSFLGDRVNITVTLPSVYAWSTPEYYLDKCLERPNCLTFIPKHATPEWLRHHILPKFDRHQVVTVDGFEHKLTFENLPPEITMLRCETNFYALRFVKPVREIARTLSQRMKRHDQNLLGRYIGLHVRFEKDMVAHSNCDYGGGRAEAKSLASFRYHMWNGRVRNGGLTPEDLRKNGSCPLTPEEMGLLLAGLEYTSHVPVYIAGKGAYGGRRRMRPLQDLYPTVESKETLATKLELEPFRNFSHRLTAVDFLVLLESDVFLSNAAGNFPNVLTGHRRFFGPKKSIHPDKALLARLFSNTSLGWTEFAGRVRDAHRSRLGALEKRKPKYSVFRYPAPDCMCNADNGVA